MAASHVVGIIIVMETEREAERGGERRSLLTHLRDNILQRGETEIVRRRPRGRSLSPCGRCREQNWTSKNEKWQDIDLLIAAVQTHRCEGQGGGVGGDGGGGVVEGEGGGPRLSGFYVW